MPGPFLRARWESLVFLNYATGGRVSYHWRHEDAEYRLAAAVSGPARSLAPDSEAEFVTEHYWGYTRQRDHGTLEYRVEHPAWAVWPNAEATCTGPGHALYGDDFGQILSASPGSAFVAVGSKVAVMAGERLACTPP